MSVRVELWGDYACFTRPEMKDERVSYDVMTPSAARGILESIYWHPGMVWRIDKIHVLSPIRFTNIRRNEIRSVVSVRDALSAMNGKGQVKTISTSADILQRAAMVLCDVRYVVEAHFDLLPDKMASSDSDGKFQDNIKRRLAKGRCYSQPYFGCREFPANFRSYEAATIPCEPSLAGEKDFGWMLFDMDYSGDDIKPMFFRALLKDGVIDLRGTEVRQ